MVRKVRPDVTLSAAVGALPEDARRRHFQDARRWVAEGLVDMVVPMNYTADAKGFARCLHTWSRESKRVPVVVGVMFDQRDAQTVIAQLSRAMRSSRHFSAFAYNSLFERLDRAGRPERDGQSAARTMLRKKVIPVVRRLASSGA
jgi:uncharacterized lipoprotein YddW (UPF0748 family)